MSAPDPLHRVHRAWLSPDDCERVVAVAERASARFTGGRQEGGYEKLAVRDAELVELVDRARSALTPLPAGEADAAEYVGFDAYVLRYAIGSFIPPHVDPPLADENRHLRLNAIVRAPLRGGELRLDGELVPLAEGDAVVFRPDRSTHEVSAVEGGPRLVLSVGCNYRLARGR